MKIFFISIAICCLSYSALAEDIVNNYNAQCVDTDTFWGTDENYSYLTIVFSSDKKQIKELKIGKDDLTSPNTIYWKHISLELFGELPGLDAQFENALRYRSPGYNPKGIIDFQADLEYSGTELSKFTSYNYGRSNEGGWHNRVERKVFCKGLSRR